MGILVRNSRQGAALLTLLLACLALAAFLYRHEVWLARMGAVFLTLSLVLAIRARSWLWDGIAALSLSLAAPQAWTEGKHLSAIVFTLIAVLAFERLIRRLKSLKPKADARQWPLVKGDFSGNCEEDGDRVIYYSYKVGESYYSGFVVAGSLLKKGLKAQLDSLKGKVAFVRYNPNHPEMSALLMADQIEVQA